MRPYGNFYGGYRMDWERTDTVESNIGCMAFRCKGLKLARKVAQARRDRVHPSQRKKKNWK